MTQFLFILVAILGWGVWGVCDKGAVRYVHPLVLSMMYSLIGVAIDAVMLVVARVPFVVPQRAWVWVLPSAAGSCLAFMAYTFALRSSDAGQVVSLTSAYPLVTLVLASWLLGEELTAQRLVGAALIVVGVIVVAR